MSSGIIISSAKHDAALQRLLSTSKRGVVAVCRQEFGIILENVAKFMPPAVLSQNVTGKQAEKVGKAAVSRDIRSIYGTPGDAYSLITRHEGTAKASAFWFMHSTGQDETAAQILKAATGKYFSPFDGGKAHGGTQGGRKRRSKDRREHIYYVRNPQSLESYIQQEESRVWWFASGWAPALRALGRHLPYGVDRGGGPGTLQVSITEHHVEVKAIDQISYASKIYKIEDIVRRAMDFRAERLQRNWDNWMSTLARETGLKVTK
jgi:hypothetical protein